MSSIPETSGERLVCAIKNKSIVMDYGLNTGKDFQGGYEELYFYKFKKYQSSVGRHIRNQQLNEEAYHG